MKSENKDLHLLLYETLKYIKIDKFIGVKFWNSLPTRLENLYLKTIRSKIKSSAK